MFVQTDKRTSWTFSKLSSSFDINNLSKYPIPYHLCHPYLTKEYYHLDLLATSTSLFCFSISLFYYCRKLSQQHLSMGFSSFYFYFFFIFFIAVSAKFLCGAISSQLLATFCAPRIDEIVEEGATAWRCGLV